MDDELIRHMQNWARQYPGLSMDELAKLYFNQNKMLYPGKQKGFSHDELRKWYLGEGPADKRGTRTPAYDSQPQKYPAWQENFSSPSRPVMDMLAEQLGKPLVKGVENGGYGPSIDPRIARKIVM